MILYFIVPTFTIASFVLIVLLLNIRLKSAAGRKFMDKRVASFTNKLLSDVAGLLKSNNQLEQEIAQPEYFEKIKPYIEKQVDDFLRVKLLKEMPVIGSLIGEQTILKLKLIFMDELQIIFPGAIAQYASGLKSNFATKILSAANMQQVQNNIAQTLQQEAVNFTTKLYVPAMFTGLIQGVIIDLLIRFFH